MSRRTAHLRVAILIAAPLLFVAACSGGANDSGSSADPASTDDQRVQDGPAFSAEGSANSLTVDQSDPGSTKVVEAATPPLLNREVIATAEVTLRVDDVTASLPDLIQAATAAGGYVAGEDTSSNPDDPSKTRSTVTLRVPTNALQRVVDDVTGLGELIKSRQDVRDVTEQVVDVKSRVKSGRASVSRIRVLLDQANTLGEVVRIESQLARREADLESLLAQQRALADQTAMATLTVTALGPEAASPAPEEDETGFLAGLSRGWTALVDATVVGLTGVGLLLPFAVLAGFVLVPVGLFLRRRQARPVAETS
jgi:Domain of unknown function (DUF4349)